MCDTIQIISGVYRRDRDIQVFIDVTGVEHLRTHIVADTLCIGANVNLTETMDILTEASTKHGYEYCEHMVKHIDLIANVPVRNVSKRIRDLIRMVSARMFTFRMGQ